MNNILPIAQIVISILILICILLQERSAGLSGLVGGDGGGFYQARRGLERVIFWCTVVLVVVFMALAVAQLFFK